MLKAGIFSIILFVLCEGPTFACDKYESHTRGELKELRNALQDAATDPFDRLFAYQKLACSDQPIMRTFAVNTIVGKIKDPLVKQQVAFDILFAKRRIDVEIIDDPNGSYKRRYNGRAELDVKFRHKQSGCIGFTFDNECSGTRVYINGPTLDFRGVPSRGASGILILTDVGDAYVGKIELKNNSGEIEVRVPLK